MLTPVERVLILNGADLLKDVGPRHLLRLAEVTREIQIREGDTIYKEDDPADALYMVVGGECVSRPVSGRRPRWARARPSGRGPSWTTPDAATAPRVSRGVWCSR